MQKLQQEDYERRLDKIIQEMVAQDQELITLQDNEKFLSKSTSHWKQKRDIERGQMEDLTKENTNLK